jgi:hypothetical protein
MSKKEMTQKQKLRNKLHKKVRKLLGVLNDIADGNLTQTPSEKQLASAVAAYLLSIQEEHKPEKKAA